MAYRVYFACDIVGCRITSEQIIAMDRAYITTIPEGWLALAVHITEYQENSRLVICPEHVKLFPERVRTLATATGRGT